MSEKLTANNSTWKAWYDYMPRIDDVQPTLHIKGEIDVGNESDGATVEFSYLDKKLPPNLVLEVLPSYIFIPRPEGETKIILHYSCPKPSSDGVESITINYPDGTSTIINKDDISRVD